MASLSRSLSERTFLLQKEWKDLPLPVPIYRNVTKLPAVLRIPDRILLHIAPEENALLWIFINASQVLLSLFLLLVLLSHLAINDEINNGGGTPYKQDDETIALHILGRFDIYNLITTSIWIVEVGTSLWLSSRNRDRLTCAQSIELCLALFIASHSLFFVLSKQEPQHFAHHPNSGRIDDDRLSSNNTTDVTASTITDSSTTLNLNISFLLVDICIKTVAFSYGFILVLQRFRRRQGAEFQEVAWWEDISFGGTIPPDSMSQFSNNTNARSQYKANMSIPIQHGRSQSPGSQTQCSNTLMTIYDRKQSAESAITLY